MSIKIKAFIFDIDGVLSNPSHRIEHAKNKQWDEFHEKSFLDDPIAASIEICKAIDVKNESSIIFMTGRPEKFRKITEKWLKDKLFNGIERTLNLIMRPEGDFRKSSHYKLSEYLKLKENYEVIGVFEDNDFVIKMWREQGLTCFALPSMYID
jgi:hypothetical protein